MTLKGSLIPVPEKGIYLKKGKNFNIYVYRYLSGANPKEVIIGKIDKETGLLIPNSQYHNLNSTPSSIITNIQTLPAIHSDLSIGRIFVLKELASDIGLNRCLEMVFPDIWEQLLAMAIYFVCESNAMMYIPDFFRENYIPFSSPLNGTKCSHLFSSILREDQIYFFKEWAKNVIEKEFVAYDISMISSHSNNIDLVAWGHNKDGDHLPQINLGMFYGMTSHIPIMYTLYNGSINDVTYFRFMLECAKEVGITDVKLIFDRGNYSKENFKFLHDRGITYVTSMPKKLIDFSLLLNTNRDIVKSVSNYISEYEVYGTSVDYIKDDMVMKAHIYFDLMKQASEEKLLYSHIADLETNLKNIGNSVEIGKKFTDYFNVTQRKRLPINFERDFAKIDSKLKNLGFFILLSNDKDINSQTVLSQYRQKDFIEKHFSDLKNPLEFDRMRTHSQETTTGKFFIGFLALILRSCLLKRIKLNEKIRKMTVEKALIELRQIRVIMLEDKKVMYTPLTKTQKGILDGIGISKDKLLNKYV
jgi:transposase